MLLAFRGLMTGVESVYSLSDTICTIDDFLSKRVKASRGLAVDENA